MIYLLALCLSEAPPSRWGACAEVVAAAVVEGVSPALAVRVAAVESCFDRAAVSRRGARGALQVVPRWWCPAGPLSRCNLARAGARALRVQTERFGLVEGLARYNAGNAPGPRARRYALGVLGGASSCRR